jgi:hypothetical protein
MTWVYVERTLHHVGKKKSGHWDGSKGGNLESHGKKSNMMGRSTITNDYSLQTGVSHEELFNYMYMKCDCNIIEF